ncbi:PREDICTED: uncharacterized protein LOC109182005 [Ipomoea nil]|uniref:uncharacterized protein LOC109182005 n=1 Tax=Ipomoea nil TaxID=35883 RepID=UPI000901CAE2|nr:PREDICTED: uncharacterized protein LOC109182005 [Ipomoea nil]
MASSPTTNHAADENDGDISEMDSGSKSYFQKAVCLTDWWLVKAENDSRGKRLAVGGFTLRHNVRQEFSSAPIEKVYDVFTLETMDGICILLKGFLNKTRTRENGFPSKVFDNFILGFPPNWESFAVKDSWEESPPKVSEIAIGPQKSSSCSQSVSEFRKTTRKNKNDASSAETHGPECKKNLKTKVGSKKGNRSEETENKACRQKSTNKAVSISQRFRSCYNKQNQTSEGGTLIDRKIASTSGSKAKRKLSYEEPLLENGRGGASAQSAEPSTSNDLRSEIIDNNLRGNSEDETSKGENQKDGGVNKVVIQKNTSKAAQSSVDFGCARSATPGKNRQNGVSAVTSPQSLSYKRSRSGRLLLPPLKFWQNQRAIYDSDRRVTGIVKDPDATI